MRQSLLKSCMDTPVKKVEQPASAEEPKTPPKQRPQKAESMHVTLSNVPASMTEAKLQKLCQGTKLYQIMLPTDSLKGTASGHGDMGIRYNDEKALSKTMNNLVSKGITIEQDKPKAFNKTLNYHGLATAKLHDLEFTKYTMRANEAPKSINRPVAPKVSRAAESGFLWKKIMHPVLGGKK